MGGDLGHPLAKGSQASGAIEGAKQMQQRSRPGQMPGRGRIEPGKLGHVGRSPPRQIEDERGEIGTANLRWGERKQRPLGAFGPQPVADPGSEAPGATGTLGGAGAGNTNRLQGSHAASGVKTGPPLQTGVDHHRHSVDGQAGFGDIGGQHDLAPRSGQNRPLLVGKREVAIEGTDIDAHRQIGKRFDAAADIARAGKENQQIAGRLAKGPSYRRRNVVAHPAPRLLTQIANLNGIRTPRAADQWTIAQQTSHRGGIEGRRHHQQLEVVAQTQLGVPTQRQGKIGVKVAFVEFIEDDQSDS